jgi:hypothetical protein
MRNVFCRAWNIARKLKNVNNKKGTVEEMEYGEMWRAAPQAITCVP